jgi:hypothetical protein
MTCVAGMLVLVASAAPAQTALQPAAKPAPKTAQAGKSAAEPMLIAQRRRPSARRQAGNWRTRQQVIDRQRAREIQQALVREGYLEKGDADGIWGERSKAAMERYQAKNGWQSKIVPDSRALIKLGLGPQYAGVINPESLAPREAPGDASDGSDGSSKTAGAGDASATAGGGIAP